MQLFLKMVLVGMVVSTSMACRDRVEPALPATPPPPPPPPVEPRPTTTVVRVLPAVVIPSTEPRCRTRQIFFATESADLSEEARNDLTAYARCLQNTAVQEDITLRGRTDPRGTDDYNEALSRRRAEAVATFLQSQGVSANQLRVRALGETGASEGMPDLWPQQRRVTAVPTDSALDAAPAPSP